MDLLTYFKTTKPAEREVFAKAVGANVDYLYLCSRGTRKPGPDLCKRIVAHDSRFTLAELRDDIWGNGIDAMAASDDAQNPAGTSSRKVKEFRVVA